MRVPWPNLGFMRRVYPGFLQLSGFLAMNMDRHVDAHVHQFRNLVRGDGDGTEQHRIFYDEYPGSDGPFRPSSTFRRSSASSRSG